MERGDLQLDFNTFLKHTYSHFLPIFLRFNPSNKSLKNRRGEEEGRKEKERKKKEGREERRKREEPASKPVIERPNFHYGIFSLQTPLPA